MKKTDVLIIGGSAGGLTAAISARRNYPQKKITLVRKEEKVLIPCAIPYLFKTIDSVEKDLIPDAVLSKNQVDLVVDEATELNPNQKVAKTAKGSGIGYKKLILATGSLPVVPPIDGVNLENVFVAKKEVGYLEKMVAVLKEAKEIVIIGGGFIGVEFADELAKAGKKITIVEMLPHCLQLAFDEEFCLKGEEKLRQSGVVLRTGILAQRIGGEGKVEYVKLKNGEKLPVEAVILGIGVRPNVELAQAAALKIGKTKAIKVDEYQRTSDKDIFAVGDCAEKTSFFTGKPSKLRLASIATREARIAATNLFRPREKNGGTIGTFATIIGGLALGVAGLTEKAAEEAKIKVVKGEAVTLCKHPGAMPGSKETSVKLLFTKAGRIVGGQVYGDFAVGEVVNVIAALIQKRAQVEEVVKLQIGTHPALTPSPIAYPIVSAAAVAKTRLKG